MGERLIQVYDSPECLSDEQFRKDHLYQHIPCIIRNCTTKLKINKWNLNYISHKCGHNDIFVRSETNKPEYKNGTQYKSKKIKLEKYISDLLSDSKSSKNSYLAALNVRHSLPELKPDIQNLESDFPEYLQTI